MQSGIAEWDGLTYDDAAAAGVPAPRRSRPAEISQATRDHVMKGQGGECVGLAQIAGQCGRFQPSAKSPIGGLFYTGADVGIPGMGTHKASGGGIKTARMVLQYQRLKQSTL
ncbi:MAG: hypothetical protein FJ020_08505 [Chloroflexi bacterium]|nr:hypothetical protein [Chloroflexota bacterium]